MNQQQSSGSLLRDSRRDAWIMTMPNAYFICEIARDVRPGYVDVRRRWLDVVAACAVAAAALGGAYVGLWWALEKALALTTIAN